jgi:hypothetical protein
MTPSLTAIFSVVVFSNVHLTDATIAGLKPRATEIAIRLKPDTPYYLQAGDGDVLRRGEWTREDT